VSKAVTTKKAPHRRSGGALLASFADRCGPWMAEPLSAALQEQRARSELAGELVFPGRAGTPIELANFRHRNWPRILRRAGLTERPLYQCRHTLARLALEAGEAPQWVAAQLGHTSVQMVFQVYGRWARPPARRALFDQLAQTICPPSAQTGGKLAGRSGRSGQYPQQAVSLVGGKNNG
jgi:hypothetical protein